MGKKRLYFSRKIILKTLPVNKILRVLTRRSAGQSLVPEEHLCVGVNGVTEIDNKVFVVFGLVHKSSNIEVYDSQTFNQLSVIKVEGLKEPRDIGSLDKMD